jgi:hypothetical protein
MRRLVLIPTRCRDADRDYATDAYIDAIHGIY